MQNQQAEMKVEELGEARRMTKEHPQPPEREKAVSFIPACSKNNRTGPDQYFVIFNPLINLKNIQESRLNVF